MADFAKVATVAKREYLIQVRRWSFWLFTLGMPIFFLLIGVVMFAIAFFSMRSHMSGEGPEIPRVIGVVDPATLIDLDTLNAQEIEENSRDELSGITALVLEEFELPETMVQGATDALAASGLGDAFQYKPIADLETGKTALREKEMRALLVLSPSFREDFEAQLWRLDEETAKPVSLHDVEQQLSRKFLLEHFGEDEIAHILEPLDEVKRTYVQEPEPEEEEEDERALTISQISIGTTYMMALMLLVLTSTDRLLRGLVEEKQNRVIEILLSSVTADQLMGGKVLGLGGLAFTQFGVWMLMGFIPGALLLRSFDIGILSMIGFSLYFVLGYLLIATLILGFGSLVNTYQEASQWTLIIVLGFICPMYAIPLLINDPSALTGRILTFIPFTSPIMAVFRLGADQLPLWEAAASLIVLALSIVVALKVCGKIFRLGILLTGKPPNPARLFKLLRDA
ncbi:ABC transporter permease [Sulfidibacter corallicola]|uniref:ABC transporter permease n=1 Tax=Sulfidibacter corallicola TaxID=2818388 RepID=A0A8A4TKK6_SULCO|nr:ABC transporter permease [Sulfidibacter corallicola]QTD49734.1 ABC transporter permease [Sulfidibacter corallicola]